jgi:hypothetical protein
VVLVVGFTIVVLVAMDVLVTGLVVVVEAG